MFPISCLKMRQIAEKSRIKNSIRCEKEQKRMIFKQMLREAKSGLTCTVLRFKLSDANLIFLKEKGYRLEFVSATQYYTIYWKEE